MKKFHAFLLVGGMPEAVARYAETWSFIDLDPVYESILTGLRDDVSKYASAAKTKYIQHIIEHATKYVGLQIKYEKFGESNFRCLSWTGWRADRRADLAGIEHPQKSESALWYREQKGATSEVDYLDGHQ